MQNLTLETMPSFLEQMATEIEDIKSILSEKHPQTLDTSKKKYNLKQAALYCGMAEPTFRTYIYRRNVAGTKFGKAWLFLEKDLDQFIQDYRQPTADELKAQAFDNLTGGNK